MKAMPHSPIAIFDLDGTLADTAPDLMVALNHAVELVGFSPLTRDDIGHLTGHGSLAMIDRAIALNNASPDETVRTQLQKRFLDFYVANICKKTRLFGGAEALLEALGAQGFVLAVCTNKPEAMARQLLGELGLAEMFAAVTGGDSFDYRKPDGRHIARTIELAGGDPAHAIMIGDTITDVKAARAAGIAIGVVDFGYSETSVETLKADAVISNFHGAEQTIKTLLTGSRR